jgi:hypothetical protein
MTEAGSALPRAMWDDVCAGLVETGPWRYMVYLYFPKMDCSVGQLLKNMKRPLPQWGILR